MKMSADKNKDVFIRANRLLQSLIGDVQRQGSATRLFCRLQSTFMECSIMAKVCAECAKATSALHSSVFRNSTRSLSLMSRVRDSMTGASSRSEKVREQRAFEAQMKYLKDEKRPIDANVYLETIIDLKQASGLSGFREHLPWVQNSPILQDMKKEDQILRALPEKDRRNPAFVTIAVKKRVARSAGADLPEVDALLDRICLMYDIQKWIVRRKRADLHLPTSSAELQSMISTPSSGMRRSFTFKRKVWPNPGVKPKKNRSPF